MSMEELGYKVTGLGWRPILVQQTAVNMFFHVVRHSDETNEQAVIGIFAADLEMGLLYG